MLILDEPTTGLDYREQRRMMALVSALNREGIAIVMITHTPWLVAEYARRVVLIRRGRKLYDGGVREFFAKDELLASSSFRAPEATELSRISRAGVMRDRGRGGGFILPSVVGVAVAPSRSWFTF